MGQAGHNVLWVLSLAVLVVGCRGEETRLSPTAEPSSQALREPPYGPTTLVSAPMPGTSGTASVSPNREVDDDQAHDKTVESVSQQPSPATAEFEPPFGPRSNLFVPKARARSVDRRRPPKEGSDLQLKGFANVHQPRAVLVLDGRVVTLAVGQSVDGLKVIAIDPPRVELQKGARRWFESIGPSRP